MALLPDSTRLDRKNTIRLATPDPIDAVNTPLRQSANSENVQESREGSPQVKSTPKMTAVVERAVSPDLLRPSTPDTPGTTGDLSSTPWIGGTGLGSAGMGKTGRVIERLMSDNDRLKREHRSTSAKCEEVTRALEATKPALDALRTENSRLTNIKSMDDNIIARRDRKIAELKAEIEVERQKRLAAESRAAEADRAREDGDELSRKQLQAALEEAKHATTHADILRTSHQQLSREYRTRFASTTKHLRELTDDREEDKKKLVKMDVVVNMMKKELERTRKQHQDYLVVSSKLEEAKSDKIEELEQEAVHMRQLVGKREEENLKLTEDMVETLGRMKWLMQMQMARESAVSPPPSPGA
ncbi:hypothetical protein MBLNU457_g0619t1 [Dothideomycetes sp. NU457]